MTIEVLSFLVGSVLIGVAIIGGGFELKELKIPRVGVLARLMSTGAGIAFIGLALGLWAGRNREIFSGSAATPLASSLVTQSGDTTPASPPGGTDESQTDASADPFAGQFDTDTLAFDGFSGTSTVDWTIGPSTYEAVLQVDGERGSVTVSWVDENGNSSQVDEDLRLEKDESGVRYRGSNPRYSGTSTPYPEYRPDIFTVVRNTDGWTYGAVCDGQECYESTLR